VFGKTFFKMTYKVIRYLFGKTFALLYRLTGLKFLSGLVAKLTGTASGNSNWMQQFSGAGDDALKQSWGNSFEGGNQ